MESSNLIHQIFNIKNNTDFEETALKVFRFQYHNNALYQRYCKYLKKSPQTVQKLNEIPFLPIQFFKSQTVYSSDKTPQIEFLSSGTTGMSQSKHAVADLSVYERSFLASFKQFIGNPEEMCILALLPSYLERKGSSLIYMCQKLIEKSPYAQSGFYLNNYDDLLKTLSEVEQQKIPTLLIGVSFALLDLSEKLPEGFQLKHTQIMETGGMKGRRKELIRDELHKILKQKFGVSQILSEYGMTELLSQAYLTNGNTFNTPPWLKILIRDTNDPFTYLNQNRTGGINVIDLANIYSCAFIETKDLGKLHNNQSFEVLGRFDNSDIRGCNLLIEQ